MLTGSPAPRSRCAILVAALALALTAAAAADDPHWFNLPIRSHAEFDLGLPGGEAEQHPQGLARSLSDPDILYLSHDVGGVWRSDDGGLSWSHTIGDGLLVQMGQSVEVDPVNPDTVFAIMDNAWNWLAPSHTGIYRSHDAGRNWELVLHSPDTTHQRTHQQNLAFDRTSVNDQGAQRWYAAFPNDGLWRSDDGGTSWTGGASLAGHGVLYGVEVHPGNGDRVFVHSSEGLFMSNNGGQTLSPFGNLPAGEVTSLNIAPDNPHDVFATVRGQGLFRSLNGGSSFEPFFSHNAMYGIVHPTDRDQIYVIGQGGANSRATSDGGETWVIPQTEPFPGLGREGSWKGRLEGSHSAISPDPRDASVAAGYSRATLWHTTDGGASFQDGSAGFTGYNWAWFTTVAAFDPHDADRFAFFNQDVGMTITDNGGQWFDHGPVPWEYRASGALPFTGMYAGDLQPVEGSQVMVASGGLTWNTGLLRTDDGGATWDLVDPDLANNLYIRFHPDAPNVVYAGAKRSDDAGQTFNVLPHVDAIGGEIMGMAQSQPDTIYAMNSNRNQVWRSDDRGENWELYVQTNWTMRRLDSKPTFLVDPQDPEVFYTINSAGDLARYDGQSWTTLPVLHMTGVTTGSFVRNIAIDPRDNDIIYAGMHGAGRPFLFRSVDRGQTWEDISGNLPRLGIGGLAVHPLTGDVFIGGAAGTHVLAPPYQSPDAHYWRLSVLPGDMNLDGVVDVGDIAPFVLALADPEAYIDAWGVNPVHIGDLNDDGTFDTGDVAPFVAMLADNAQSVPEPGSLMLLAVGGLLLMRRGRDHAVAT